MTDRPKSQIFDYIFSNKEVPAHILDEFSRWLVEHESDQETEQLMLEKWDEYSKTLFEESDLKGLKTVRKKIRRKEKTETTRVNLLMSVAAMLIGGILFFAGYSSAVFNRYGKEITLVTAEGNIGEFTLPDGTKVWLNENTRLTYPESFDGKTREVELCGEAFFEVRKDAERPFMVQMHNLDVEVLGTSFGAACYLDRKVEEIILKNGSVKISGESMQNSVVLKPNERLTYSPFDGNVCVTDFDVENAYRWYEKYLSFDNARFGDILSNIEHRYNVEIRPLTSVSMDKRLSLTIIHEPLETIMDVMSTLLPIRYEIHGNSLIIRDKYNN